MLGNKNTSKKSSGQLFIAAISYEEKTDHKMLQLTNQNRVYDKAL